MWRAGSMAGLVACVCAIAVPAAAPAQARTRPKVTTYQVVQPLRLDPGQSGTFTLSCRPDDLATDGVWQIDTLDGSTDVVDAVDVLEADSISAGGYRFSLRNNAAGVAAVQLAVVCVGGSVGAGANRSTLQLSEPLSTTTPIAGGTDAAQTVTCPAGSVAVTPGLRLVAGPGGVARLTASFPMAPDLRTLERRAMAFADVQLTTTARCLSALTAAGPGPRRRLALALRTASATLTDGRRETYTVSCRPRETAITGAFGLTGGWYIGQSPAGRRRTFRAQSPQTGADGVLQLGVLCLGNRAGAPRR